MLTVTVNKREEEIPEDFGSTPREFLEAVGYGDQKEYDLFMVTDIRDGANLTEEDKCSEPLVVSDGDEFVAIPKYVTGG